MATVPALAKHYDVLALGDSITQGLYEIPSPQSGTRVGGYEPRLESQVSSGSNGKNDAAIYNWGTMGEYSIGGVNRIDSVLNSRSADYILLMYGANDVFSFISATSVAANVGIMVDKARAKNVEPIISNITPNTNHELGVDFNSYIVFSYNPAIQSMAQDKNVPIADNYAALASGWPFPNASSDGLHPSGTGYQRMAEEWYKILDPLINASLNMTPVYMLLLLDN